jgi:hypothetical protein
MIINELNVEMLKQREVGNVVGFHLLAKAHATICRLTMAIRVDDPNFSNRVFTEMEANGLFAYADEVILQSKQNIKTFKA